MKVAVKDLLPNPFRSPKIPFDQEKLKQLEQNINTTGFWDNIVARQNDGKYEIAYGHHRLEVLKKLKWKEVDIPIRDLDDKTMLQMMAEENMDEWSLKPIISLETVFSAYKYLEDAHTGVSVEPTKDQIVDLIGWPPKRVEESLINLRALGRIKISEDTNISNIPESLPESVAEDMPTMKHLTALRKSVKKRKPSKKVIKVVSHRLKERNKADAEQEKEIPSKDVDAMIKEEMKNMGEVKQEVIPKPRPQLNDHVQGTVFRMMSKLEVEFGKLKGMLKYLNQYNRETLVAKLGELDSAIKNLLKEEKENE